MIARATQSGFTAVELLVAIMVGVLLLMSSYQLYSVALSSSGDAQRRTAASMAAYDMLRARQSSITAPCASSTTTPAVPSSAGLPNATASVVATCPYNEYAGATLIRNSDVTLLTATITYDTSPNIKQVSRAVAIFP